MTTDSTPPIFPSVHAALSFAWRLETASPQPSQLYAMRATARNSGKRTDMTTLEWAGQAAVIRKLAQERLDDVLLAYVVARYSGENSHVRAAFDVLEEHVRRQLNSRDLGNSTGLLRPLVESGVRGSNWLRARRASQRSLASEHGTSQSTVSRIAGRVGRELNRLRLFVDDSMHHELQRRGMVPRDE